MRKAKLVLSVFVLVSSIGASAWASHQVEDRRGGATLVVPKLLMKISEQRRVFLMEKAAALLDKFDELQSVTPKSCDKELPEMFRIGTYKGSGSVTKVRQDSLATTMLRGRLKQTRYEVVVGCRATDTEWTISTKQINKNGDVEYTGKGILSCQSQRRCKTEIVSSPLNSKNEDGTSKIVRVEYTLRKDGKMFSRGFVNEFKKWSSMKTYTAE